MLMTSWTDNPGMDAEAYYAAQERRQSEWESRCVKCIICGEPIDPNYDPRCIHIWDDYMHTECMTKKMNEAEKAVNAKADHAIFMDLFADAIEESYMELTPIPED